ncbi:papilin-like [Diaphorina citri]|uniref:Papilin-like n=1 Tax=Diaphorina citri TaxID=121845 RepID=A0A3Q0IM45_DIACI|nr:papilin-like [Diaphorina citri]
MTRCFGSNTSCFPQFIAKDICLQPAVIGDCANYVLTWYYDSLEARCRQFYYGGCGGNQNNFMTEEACQARCAGGTFVTSSAAPDQLENRIAVVDVLDVCDQPKDVGPCNGNYVNWSSPPRFHNYSEPTVEAEEGNFVTLRCIAIGYPIPVYTWSKGEVSRKFF